MKSLIIIVTIIFFICPLLVSGQAAQNNMQTGWKAGVASANITPEGPIWMQGFAFRNKPSEGITTDIWASALALEDAKGYKVVMIALDNASITKEYSDAIRARLKTAYTLTNEQIVINCSHTHTGPTTVATSLKDEKIREKVERYAAKLEDQIVEITGQALSSLQPVRIFSGNGVIRFQVNRRTNIQYKLHLQEHFNGPNDYTVSVLKVEKVSGGLLAVLFGYACHASMMRDYKISGDYPAFARMELKKLYPGATSLFFQGAAGNQIGYPRSTVEATRQAGKSLAAAVERVLSGPMRELSPSLTTSYAEINLKSDQVPPTKDELTKIASNTSNSDSIRNKAKEDLEKLSRGESLIATYPYPVQVWKIGDLPVFTLGGEPVIDYAKKLRLIFGQDAFVFGYSNYRMAYITTPLILTEGGYEGSSTPFIGAKWALDIEPVIIEEALKLAKQVEIPMTPKKFAIPGG